MTRHLNTCVPAYDSHNGHVVEVFRLRVDGGPESPYWIDLELKAQGKLALLDTFMRNTWLVCDGARSRFVLSRGEVYTTNPRRSQGERSLQAPMTESFAWLRGWFAYECGTDSPIELRMRITNRRLGRVGRSAIRLLARNERHTWPCTECGTPATKVCADDHTLLCAVHAKEHPCRKKSLRPVVDSPIMNALLAAS